MELYQTKSIFTEEEREEALRKARKMQNLILIDLAYEAVTGQKKYQIWMHSAIEKKLALRKALMVKEPVLVELTLGIVDDIEGLETSLVKHKIQVGDFSYIKEILSRKTMNAIQLNGFVILALGKKNTDMLELFFSKGASKAVAMKHALQMGRLDSVILLTKAGCDLNFEKNIKDIIDGCPRTYQDVINWLLEQMPDNSLNRENFERMFHYARTFGKDHIARHIKECLEVYDKKFISVNESVEE